MDFETKVERSKIFKRREEEEEEEEEEENLDRNESVHGEEERRKK